MRLIQSRWLAVVLLLAVLGTMGGCAGLPPGADYPRSRSTALADPAAATPLGKHFEAAAQAHAGNSGYRLVPSGFEGFLLRAQMLDAAQQSVDMQYYIFHADETGKLLIDAILRAADRGVRVRLLLDDVDNTRDDAQVEALDAHPNIEVRLFNPLRYRGQWQWVRGMELLLWAKRLDRRMHNKQLVIDNTAVLVGGRNIGDEYFQRDPEAQQGDFETFAAGPIVRDLSKTFDEFWASTPAIPAEALLSSRNSPEALAKLRASLKEHREEKRAEGSEFVRRLATGEPWRSILDGSKPLTYAPARIAYDSPEAKQPQAEPAAPASPASSVSQQSGPGAGAPAGGAPPAAVAQAPGLGDEHGYGPLISRVMAQELRRSRYGVSMVSAYFVPGEDGMRLIDETAARGIRIRLVTNSLAANNEPLAHSGYLHYRKRLLQDGVDLYEVRAKPGSPRGTAQPLWLSSYGNYSLHTKLFVFDDDRIFVSSMNFDQRSLHLNTELGLVIESPELAAQGLRFIDALAQPANAYHVTLETNPATDGKRVTWRSEEDGREVETHREPAKSEWQRLAVHFYALLPLDGEL